MLLLQHRGNIDMRRTMVVYPPASDKMPDLPRQRLLACGSFVHTKAALPAQPTLASTDPVYRTDMCTRDAHSVWRKWQTVVPPPSAEQRLRKIFALPVSLDDAHPHAEAAFVRQRFVQSIGVASWRAQVLRALQQHVRTEELSPFCAMGESLLESFVTAEDIDALCRAARACRDRSDGAGCIAVSAQRAETFAHRFGAAETVMRPQHRLGVKRTWAQLQRHAHNLIPSAAAICIMERHLARQADKRHADHLILRHKRIGETAWQHAVDVWYGHSRDLHHRTPGMRQNYDLSGPLAHATHLGSMHFAATLWQLLHAPQPHKSDLAAGVQQRRNLRLSFWLAMARCREDLNEYGYIRHVGRVCGQGVCSRMLEIFSGYLEVDPPSYTPAQLFTETTRSFFAAKEVTYPNEQVRALCYLAYAEKAVQAAYPAAADRPNKQEFLQHLRAFVSFDFAHLPAVQIAIAKLR